MSFKIGVFKILQYPQEFLKKKKNSQENTCADPLQAFFYRTPTVSYSGFSRQQ